ncbi:DegT/DnrJ/EryC1/StrS family aminotransferase, partial [Pseudanabaenaceae cyanobacterium LEGE 13415]|nr:DegT/DnrJ/EryC1/StrS family aminotransferase [Pseudanabaenaceae cyanobacterium LEGE 13415]
EFGTNSRLDSIQAAILNVKLPHLHSWNRDRAQIAEQYNALLKPLQSRGLIPIFNQSGKGHVYHLYVMRVLKSELLDRETLQERLEAQGIQTGIHYPLPCHLQPAFKNLGYRKGDFPVAEALCEEISSLPMYPGLTEAQVIQVVGAIEQSLATPAVIKLPV